MKYIKNVDPYIAIDIKEVVNHKNNQIVSKSFINTENTELRFFSIAKGENIDKENYPQETIFVVTEGSLKVLYKENEELVINKDEMIVLESNIDYGIEALVDTKMYTLLVR